jgi:CubicO group peptidase (beta-lactamase class C family)
VSVSAFGTADGPRFSLLWQNRTFSGSDLRYIDSTVTDAMQAAHTVGLSLAITHRGRLMFAKSYGLADSATGTPLHTTYRFRVASLSKPFTAIEIVRLVEAGKIPAHRSRIRPRRASRGDLR